MNQTRSRADLAVLVFVVAAGLLLAVSGLGWWLDDPAAPPAWPSVCRVVQPEDLP